MLCYLLRNMLPENSHRLIYNRLCLHVSSIHNIEHMWKKLTQVLTIIIILTENPFRIQGNYAKILAFVWPYSINVTFHYCYLGNWHKRKKHQLVSLSEGFPSLWSHNEVITIHCCCFANSLQGVYHYIVYIYIPLW